MKYSIYIFGEMHTTKERDRIEKEIIALHKKGKIQFLLTEEIGPYTAIDIPAMKDGIRNQQYSIGPRSYQLGMLLDIPVIGIDDWDDKVYSKDVKKSNGEYIDCTASFAARERRMTEVIKKFGDQGGCAVIVGDSHLRGLPNPVMGDVSPIQKAFLNMPNVFISRSPTSELNEHGLVKVSGDGFNNHVYDELVKLGNILVDDQRAYYDQKRQARGGLEASYYEKDDFLIKDKAVYCSVNDNVIVSMVVATMYTPTFINVGPVVTHPKFQGKGLASAIFTHLFNTYPKDKYAYELGVYPSNTSAIKFYKKLGFKEIHTTMGI